MPFCHKCGSKLEPGDEFCFKCGTQVKDVTEKDLDTFDESKKVAKSPQIDQVTVINPPVLKDNTEALSDKPVQTASSGSSVISQTQTKSADETENARTKKTNKILKPLIVTLSALGVLIVGLSVVLANVIKNPKALQTSDSTVTTESYVTTESTTVMTTTEETTTVSSSTDETSAETTTVEETSETTSQTTSATTVKTPQKITVTNAVNITFKSDFFGKKTKFMYPKVTIPGKNTNAANKFIKNKIGKYYSGKNKGDYSAKYSYYIGKKVVSILVEVCETWSSPSNYLFVFNISVKTGKLINDSELIRLYGSNDSKFFKSVKSFYISILKEDEYTEKEKNYLLNRVSYKYLNPYIGKNGHLCFTAKLYDEEEGTEPVIIDLKSKEFLAGPINFGY